MDLSLPLLAAPGMLEDEESWQAALAPLGRAVEVVANHGETVEQMAQALLDRATPCFVLLGHSLGGYVAQQVVLTAPERVAALVLVSTSARAETDASRERREQLVATARQDFAAVVAQFGGAVLASESRMAHLDAVVSMMLGGGVERFAREQHAAGSRPVFAGRIGAIACPTLVVTGTADVVIDPQASREIAGEIPSARLIELEGCGHMPHLERAEPFVAALRDWLEQT